jgi:hypothetical protein
MLNGRVAAGWGFRRTTLTADFDEDDLIARTDDAGGRLVLVRRGDSLRWLSGERPSLQEGDVVLSFVPGAAD